MIQLKLTNEGLSAFTNTTNYKLTLTHFVFGSSYDDTEQAIQDESPVQFNIDFQETYIKGQTYQRNGSDVVEEYNHIKIIGYFSANNVSTFDENGEYIVHELALMGSTTENANICLAYGYDVEGIKLYENTDTIYTVKLDLIFDKVPNISVNNSVGTVTYRDFLDHVDKPLNTSNPVHGLTYVNNRLYINGSPLVIDVSGVKNTSFNGAIGISEEVEVLPSASTETTGKVVIDKETGTMSQVVEVGGIKSWQTLYPLLTQINAMSFLPLRQDSTAYAVGDVVKIVGLSPFQYLECIATGTSASSLPPFNRTTGHATQDGTAIWLVCDMRDGLQPGDMKYRFVNTDLAGYIKDNQTILYFDQQTPIENAYNWRLLRLIRLILNQALLQNPNPSLFDFTVTASINTASTNPTLLHGAGVVIINQWCNLTPTNLTTIEDITLQNYIDISTYNTKNFVSYTETQYKATAQTLLDDILAGSGYIQIKVSDLIDRFIKLQNDINWISRFEDEGLPNITGYFGSSFNGTAWLPVNENGGAFTSSQQVTNIIKPTNFTTNTGKHRFEFKASDSNAIYGNSSHVLPKNIHLCPFIKY